MLDGEHRRPGAAIRCVRLDELGRVGNLPGVGAVEHHVDERVGLVERDGRVEVVAARRELDPQPRDRRGAPPRLPDPLRHRGQPLRPVGLVERRGVGRRARVAEGCAIGGRERVTRDQERGWHDDGCGGRRWRDGRGEVGSTVAVAGLAVAAVAAAAHPRRSRTRGSRCAGSLGAERPARSRRGTRGPRRSGA